MTIPDLQVESPDRRKEAHHKDPITQLPRPEILNRRIETSCQLLTESPSKKQKTTSSSGSNVLRGARGSPMLGQSKPGHCSLETEHHSCDTPFGEIPLI